MRIFTPISLNICFRNKPSLAASFIAIYAIYSAFAVDRLTVLCLPLNQLTGAPLNKNAYPDVENLSSISLAKSASA